MFADFGSGENFAIRVMLTYSGLGSKRNGMQPVTSIPPGLSQLIPRGVNIYANFNNESILNYLELPVMAKVEGG